MEALGQDAIELLIDPEDFAVANDVTLRVMGGENWTGQLPVKNKMGQKFMVVATNTPFYDDGALVGIICVSSDSRPFQELKVLLASGSKQQDADSNTIRSRIPVSAKLGLDPQQPLQIAIASKLSNLVSLFGFISLCFIVVCVS